MTKLALFRSILVATDGSPNGMRAVEVAANLAKTLNSRLAIATVILTPSYMFARTPEAAMSPVDIDEYIKLSTAEAEKVLRDAKKRADEIGAKASTDLISNVPSVVQAIVEHAEKRNVDLIVVGTRGLSGFKKMLMGSVSSGIVTHATCSVIVVR
jgi:nucleotide-binding universal stress UspA family protein